jgi:hypothetical protein
MLATLASPRSESLTDSKGQVLLREYRSYRGRNVSCGCTAHERPIAHLSEWSFLPDLCFHAKRRRFSWRRSTSTLGIAFRRVYGLPSKRFVSRAGLT